MNHIALAVTLAILAAPAAAQTLPPAPPDYVLIGALDLPVQNLVTTRADFRVAGWIFECRSGLQPFTQRVGTVTMRFYQPGTDTSVFPASYEVDGNIPRADVPPYFAAQCPAVGPYVGYNLKIATTSLPPRGTWDVQLWWFTTDGAGRTVQHGASRTVTFID